MRDLKYGVAELDSEKNYCYMNLDPEITQKKLDQKEQQCNNHRYTYGNNDNCEFIEWDLPFNYNIQNTRLGFRIKEVKKTTARETKKEDMFEIIRKDLKRMGMRNSDKKDSLIENLQKSIKTSLRNIILKDIDIRKNNKNIIVKQNINKSFYQVNSVKAEIIKAFCLGKCELDTTSNRIHKKRRKFTTFYITFEYEREKRFISSKVKNINIKFERRAKDLMNEAKDIKEIMGFERAQDMCFFSLI